MPFIAVVRKSLVPAGMLQIVAFEAAETPVSGETLGEA
jgi:hypothetical protein